MKTDLETLSTLEKAAKHADWQQVAQNGGPPCFHLFGDKFCLRAESWVGHKAHHEFVSLASLLKDAALGQQVREMREEVHEAVRGREPDTFNYKSFSVAHKLLALIDQERT